MSLKKSDFDWQADLSQGHIWEMADFYFSPIFTEDELKRIELEAQVAEYREWEALYNMIGRLV